MGNTTDTEKHQVDKSSPCCTVPWTGGASARLCWGRQGSGELPSPSWVLWRGLGPPAHWPQGGLPVLRHSQQRGRKPVKGWEMHRYRYSAFLVGRMLSCEISPPSCRLFPPPKPREECIWPYRRPLLVMLWHPDITSSQKLRVPSTLPPGWPRRELCTLPAPTPAMP